MRAKLIGITALLMILGTALAVVQMPCPATKNVFINEHIVLYAHPSDENEYTFSWYPDSTNLNGWNTESAITEDSGQATLDGNTLTFDAPSTAGTYKIFVDITSKNAGTCTGTTCFDIVVKDCCPTALTDYCTTDTPTWCWYNSCGLTAPFTPDGSISFEWWVNEEAQFSSQGECYSPILSGSPFNQPSQTTPTASNTVTLKVIQTGTGHTNDPDPRELHTCTFPFDLVFNPAEQISISDVS